MADESQKRVDKKTRQIERQINAVYGQARVEIEEKIEDFNRRFEIKNDIYWNKYIHNEITREDYDAWFAGQMFQSQQWRAKRDQVCDILHNANEQARNIANGGVIGAFAEGANWTAYSLEHTAGINFGFGLYDQYTVTNLLVNNPQLLPEWKIDEPREYVWNQQKINNCITQGIIQGEGINDIAKRIATETSNQDKNLALTHARTAMTGAQNAGRTQRLQDAKKLGIKVVKEWMATLDGHTRDTHRDIDGEQKPVGDKWHHIKFSNGCEYPGDPKGPAREVYNCRCTLVGDLTDYPEAYQRYDNIDGKPIDNMSYREWEKVKFADKIAQENENKATKLQKKADDLQEQINKLQEKIEGEGADYEFEGIWKSGTKTYADWEEVKDSIPMKIEYFENQKQEIAAKLLREMGIDYPDEETLQKVSDELIPILRKYQYGIPSSIPNEIGAILTDWGCDDTDDIREWISAFTSVGAEKYGIYDLRVKQLRMFQNFGEEYSQLLADRDALKLELKNLKSEINSLTFVSPFGADAYTQERIDNALWARSSPEADRMLRPTCGDVWRDASIEERRGIYEYTGSYHKFNEPLRGIEYGTERYLGVGNTDLNAGHARNGNNLNAMTDIISRSTYDHDMWLQRGCFYDGMDKFFNCDMSLLRHGTQEQLEEALLGSTPIEYAFMSCGSSRGRGFTGRPIMLNIYAPSGTQMMYVEPFSQFGNGRGFNWDGRSTQSHFGGELETILQQGTQFRITKIERASDGTLYFDLQVIDQLEPQRWVP